MRTALRTRTLAPPWITVAAVAATAASVLVISSMPRSHELLLPAILAVGILLVVDRAPFLSLMALLTLSVTVFPDPLYSIEVSGVRTDPVEVLALLLVARWVVRRGLGLAQPMPDVLRPLALLGVSGLIGFAIAVHRGAEASTVLYDLKTVGYLLLAIPISEVLHDPDDRRRAVRWILVMASLASLYIIVAFLTGGLLPAGNTVDRVNTLGVVNQTSRVRLNILAIDFLAAFLLFPRLMRRDRSVIPVLVTFAPISVVLVLSLNRSTWLPLVAGWAAFMVWEFRQGGTRRPIVLFLTGVGIVSLILAMGSIDLLGKRGDIVARRALSVVDSGVIDENSLQDRSAENEAAIESILDDPVFGVGLGQPYGHVRLVHGGTDDRAYEETTYIHNSALALWLSFGVVGVGAVAWLAARILRSEPERSLRRAEHRAVVIALAAFGLQALFAGSLFVRPTIVVVGVALALITPGRRERLDEDTDVHHRPKQGAIACAP